MKTLYEAVSVAEGARKGHVNTPDGPIDMNLSTPKSMGGEGGDGTAGGKGGEGEGMVSSMKTSNIKRKRNWEKTPKTKIRLVFYTVF